MWLRSQSLVSLFIFIECHFRNVFYFLLLFNLVSLWIKVKSFFSKLETLGYYKCWVKLKTMLALMLTTVVKRAGASTRPYEMHNNYPMHIGKQGKYRQLCFNCTKYFPSRGKAALRNKLLSDFKKSNVKSIILCFFRTLEAKEWKEVLRNQTSFFLQMYFNIQIWYYWLEHLT